MIGTAGFRVFLFLIAGVGLNTHALSADAAAAPETPPAVASNAPQQASLEDMIRALRQFLTDDDIRLIFGYLLDSTIAAIRGEEAEPLPPDLAFKLQVLQRRIQKEGGQYLDSLANRLKEELARDLRERMAAPTSTPTPTPYPASPYAPPPLNPWR